MRNPSILIVVIASLIAVIFHGEVNARVQCEPEVSLSPLKVDTENKCITDYLTLSTPSSLEAKPANTRTPFGQTGLGILIFGVTDKNLKVNSCEEDITMHYSSTPDGEQTLLRSLKTTGNAPGVMIMGIQPFDNYDFSDQPAVYVMYMFFASKEDSNNELDIDKEKLPLYRQDGYYKVTIPDGAFKLSDGTLLAGAEFTYHFDATEAPRDLSYSITPASGSVAESAADIFSKDTSGIRVDFTGARYVDYLHSGNVATLTFPDGKVLKSNSPKGGGYRRYLSFTFGTSTTDWSQDGEYEFEILPGRVGIDQGEYTEWSYDGTQPNFPGMKALYVVDSTSGVLLPGVSKAEYYDVYTLTGKVLLKNASHTDLKLLEEGIYIVNGRVVRIIR